LHPNYVKSVKESIARGQARPYDELRLLFTADDTRLREIALKPEGQRSPAEQETLERGYLLALKMQKYSESLAKENS